MSPRNRRPRFCFILQPEFPINAVVLASEALRIANQNSGHPLFDFQFVSVSGEAVRASSGMWMDVDHAINECPESDYYLVFESNLPTRKKPKGLLALLRRAHRTGSVVIGIDTGAFALLQAGLGDKGDVVVHWEAEATLRESYPRVKTIDQLFHFDKSTIFCSGGVATLDLMLELIGQIYNPALATEVSNALVHKPRNGLDSQRADSDLDTAADSVSRNLFELMETHIAEPLMAADFASRLGVSRRTLDRHCQRQFGQSPMSLYLSVRLQAARNSLFYEDRKVRDVALAYGFSSSAVFCRTFKSYFGQTPSQFRNAIRIQQSSIRTPEIKRLNASRRDRAGTMPGLT